MKVDPEALLRTPHELMAFRAAVTYAVLALPFRNFQVTLDWGMQTVELLC
jgi:hypothetical protein